VPAARDDPAGHRLRDRDRHRRTHPGVQPGRGALLRLPARAGARPSARLAADPAPAPRGARGRAGPLPPETRRRVHRPAPRNDRAARRRHRVPGRADRRRGALARRRRVHRLPARHLRPPACRGRTRDAGVAPAAGAES
jgi:hypothetical protein